MINSPIHEQQKFLLEQWFVFPIDIKLYFQSMNIQVNHWVVTFLFLGERENEPVISITTPVRNTVSQWKYCHQQFILKLLYSVSPRSPKKLEMKEQYRLDNK